MSRCVFVHMVRTTRRLWKSLAIAPPHALDCVLAGWILPARRLHGERLFHVTWGKSQQAAGGPGGSHRRDYIGFNKKAWVLPVVAL